MIKREAADHGMELEGRDGQKTKLITTLPYLFHLSNNPPPNWPRKRAIYYLLKILQFGQGLMWTACLHSLRCWLKPGQLQWSWSIQDALVICLVPPLAWLEKPGADWASLFSFRVSHPQSMSLSLSFYVGLSLA